MTTNAEALCQSFDHNWTGWSPWEAITPPAAYLATGKIPIKLDIAARRWRECRRCGMRQCQDYQGNMVKEALRK